MSDLTQSDAWQSLCQHQTSIAHIHMRELFKENPNRFTSFSIHACDLLLDYSKNRITAETLKLLMALASWRDVEGARKRMFQGDTINWTEHRAVLHTALRNGGDREVHVNERDVMPDVRSELDHMEQFSQQVRSGDWKGFSGLAIRDVVNIGIGGSDLGPKMVVNALKPFADQAPRVHFVSNIDGTDLSETLTGLDPATTLFIVASKTFTTQETMTNAHSARSWLMASGASQSDIQRHFVALSTNRQGVTEFGIDPENMFVFWDWVGGRYSLWSAIGLSIALAIGMPNFRQLLQGAYEMDLHFQNAPLDQNMPVIMALVGIWYRNFFSATSHAILPYDQSLRYFPSYLQQGDMESNGKTITRSGQPVDYDTGPVIWGEPGTNGQHAFYQLIHQGTGLIPVDFIAPMVSHHPLEGHHQILLANCFAQSEALLMGRNEDEVRAELRHKDLSDDEIESLVPHKIFAGNRPSNTILMPELTPKTLGSLIALYEHKIFVQGVIWGINSFDQWGVELGKQLAQQILPEMEQDGVMPCHDSSTNGLINYFRQHRSST